MFIVIALILSICLSLPCDSDPICGGVQQNEFKVNDTRNQVQVGLVQKNQFQQEQPLDTSQTASNFNLGSQQELGVIGVQINQAKIIRIVDNYPAQQGGLEVGDAIFKIDGRQLIGYPDTVITSHLVGVPNTYVTVTVIKGTNGQLYTNRFLRVAARTGPYTQSNPEWKMTLDALSH